MRGSEAQAGQQVVDLALVGDDVGAAFMVNDRALQDGRIDLFALLRRHHLHEQLHEAVFQVVGKRHHLGDNLAGQVVEVLRQHDVGQVAVDAAGAGFDILDEVHHRAACHRTHRVGDQLRRQRLGRGSDAGMFRLGLVDRIQHLVGGSGRLGGDIAQPAAGVRQTLSRHLQFGHHAQALHGVVQGPGDGAQLLEDLGGDKQRLGTSGQLVQMIHRHGGPLFSWSGCSSKLLHDLLDFFFQRRLGEGLDDIAGRAGLGREHDVFLAGLGRHHQHRQVLEGRIFLDRLQQLEARHVGHVDVADDEIELGTLEHVQRLDAVLSLFAVVVADLLEQAAHDAAHGGEIVDNQEFHVSAHGGPLGAGCQGSARSLDLAGRRGRFSLRHFADTGHFRMQA
mmetsp:Transcript_30049/g.54625  ORF Transcript_30049/g.54625 Transcript_30049/m.54625 type:complete len:393 (-) Transcript_30049:238-1416(-)